MFYDLLSPSLGLTGTERFLYAGHWGDRVRPQMADAVTLALKGFIGARSFAHFLPHLAADAARLRVASVFTLH